MPTSLKRIGPQRFRKPVGVEKPGIPKKVITPPGISDVTGHLPSDVHRRLAEWPFSRIPPTVLLKRKVEKEQG